MGGVFAIYDPIAGTAISNNIFRNNFTDANGGGFTLWQQSPEPGLETMIIENNYFVDNKGHSGGGIYVFNVPVLLQNNVFSGNSADQSGGALYLYNNINPPLEHFATLINNSFNGNTATNNGGAIYSLMAKPLIFNSIFWNDNANNGQEIYLTSPNDTVEIGFSTINLNAIQGVALPLTVRVTSMKILCLQTLSC